MERIIELLNEKNHYLEKFYALNEAELLNFSRDSFENLENFYRTREKILEIIKYLDSEMNRAQAAMDSQETGAEYRRTVREALAVKDEYVARIIEQDIEVLSCIEAAKNGIIRELQDLRKGRKAIGGYKSPMFDKQLDEEI